MKLIAWLYQKMQKRIEPLDLKNHLDDIIIAYDDVDLLVFDKTIKKKKKK